MSENHFDLIYGEIFGNSNFDKPSVSIGKKPVELKVKEPKKEVVASNQKPKDQPKKRELKISRKVGNQEWQDESLADWPEGDYRIYCCNLGNEVTEEILTNAFKKYGSFAKCKVPRDKKTEKGLGYGFVSLLECNDYVRAMREMQGKYVGNRPIKLMPSKWTNKSLEKGAVKQGNRAEVVFEEGNESLAQKYKHFIGEKNVEKIEKILDKNKK